MRSNFSPQVLVYFAIIHVITQLYVPECQGKSLTENVANGIQGGGFILPTNSKHLNHSSKSMSDRYGHGKENVIYKVSTEDWEIPKENEFSNQFVFDNTFGRYGGGKDLFGKNRDIELFSDASKRWKPFSMYNGAGFAGRAESGLALMEALHLYKHYKAMMTYKEYGHYVGYDGSGIYQYKNCSGGCPSRTFCDSGICKCFFGDFHYLGTCVKDEIEYKKREGAAFKEGSGEIQFRNTSNFNPFTSCSNNSHCQNIDINLIRATKYKTCECRDDTMWNEQELQCQIYMDVDCSIFEDRKNTDLSRILPNTPNGETIYGYDASLSAHENKSSQHILNPKWDGCVDDPSGAKKAGYDPNYYTRELDKLKNMKVDEIKDPADILKLDDIDELNESKDCPDITMGFGFNYKTKKSFSCDGFIRNEYRVYCPKKCNACLEKWWAEHGNLDIHGITVPNYKLKENDDGTLILSMTDLSPDDTLSSSNLVNLQLDKTHPIEIKKQFCIGIKALMLKYSEPERMYQLEKKLKSSKQSERTNQGIHETQYGGFGFKWFNSLALPAVLFLSAIPVCICFITCCVRWKLKPKAERIEYINGEQQQRENTNLFGSNNSESPATAQFLPYPNSGTSYEAPCIDPAEL